MKKTFTLIGCLFLLATSSVSAQTYAIVIKGGRVIDPKNNIDAIMDVAISAPSGARAKDGKIVLVSKNIDVTQAKQVIDATGLIVVPGLIDIHSHNFPGIRPGDPDPDGFTLRTGITTTVDAGSSGYKTFERFKKETIDRSDTRVLSWLNIVGMGFGGNEQDSTDMVSKPAADMAMKYPDLIVGFKVAHYNGKNWTAVDNAIAAGNMAGGKPIMVDFGGGGLSIEELFLKHFRPGDIFTHCFAELGKSREPIVDPVTKKVKPFVFAAQKRGVVFDVGWGGISFAYSQAIPALKQGFYPNSLGTDMNHSAINSSMKDLPSIMTKFLAMGMPLNEVIRAATWNPAKEIKHEELGSLSQGAGADVAIFNMRKGDFGLFDYTGYKIHGTQKFECEMTIRGGRIVYDLNGRAYAFAK